jgi:hypothetical protein
MGYDIGCLYPAEMPPPFVVRKSLGFRMAEYFMEQKDETPVVIHNAHVQAQLQANCVAFHNAKVLNSITLERPIFDIPSEYHNTYAISMCMAQAYYNYFGEEVAGYNLMNWNFPIYDRVPETCHGDATCLENLAIDLDYDPRFIAQIVIDEIYAKQEVDGWNALGNKKYSQASEGEVECTANCAPYMDTYGYFPLNHPGEENYEDKYSVTGDNAHWQPIQEANEWGSFSRQEHITPHIGFKAPPHAYEYKEAPPPEYDFKAEAELVVQRLADTAGNQTKKDMIPFFDNKFYVRSIINRSLTEQFPHMAFGMWMVFILGISTAEIDGLVNCWREKVRHDIVRPTTVIQRWGEDIINTYGGDPSATGPVDIRAEDFHAYIRVMPHAEYPSGSASLCTAYADFTDAFTNHVFFEKLNVLKVGGPDGEKSGCEGESSFSYGCGESFHTPTLEEFADVCGESRLWGGMHFSASTAAGAELVKGIGFEAGKYMAGLIKNNNWPRDKDDRPMCNSR